MRRRGRLGETGKYKTLLLEAGGKDTYPWIHIPMGYAKLYANPAVNWCYSSEPEPELNGRRLFQPRGKVLGGTGSINGMIYMRGQPRISTVGGNWAAPVGATRTCCPTSKSRSTSSAARTNITLSRTVVGIGPSFKA